MRLRRSDRSCLPRHSRECKICKLGQLALLETAVERRNSERCSQGLVGASAFLPFLLASQPLLHLLLLDLVSILQTSLERP
jgi:hypothetical protein